ncbi:hypothetical protein BN1058_00429 [Paraliobacillus sp. PM-2]|uniref:hypothetical protein n=1 Tax=Paraliobacillus sp. PM-2 TaxID=1462524 RepID=UPI00061C85E5|nr:hypothetical protein [Paraliobacillus sp. PM-2]CQR46178.1 hypothetical protein BN1058_00429 [Paraliobacillus sp. PM-2]
MRKKWIGLVLTFVLLTSTQPVLTDTTPTDDGKVIDNTPELMYDPGQGDTGS